MPDLERCAARYGALTIIAATSTVEQDGSGTRWLVVEIRKLEWLPTIAEHYTILVECNSC